MGKTTEAYTSASDAVLSAWTVLRELEHTLPPCVEQRRVKTLADMAERLRLGILATCDEHHKSDGRL